MGDVILRLSLFAGFVMTLASMNANDVAAILASSPGLRGGGERRPGIDYMRMRQIFPGIFRKNVRKVGGERARKSFTERVHGEPRAPSVSYTIWQVFIPLRLQSSKEDGRLDRHSLLET